MPALFRQVRLLQGQRALRWFSSEFHVPINLAILISLSFSCVRLIYAHISRAPFRMDTCSLRGLERNLSIM